LKITLLNTLAYTSEEETELHWDCTKMFWDLSTYFNNYSKRLFNPSRDLIYSYDRISDIEAQYYADGEDAYAMVSTM